MNKSVILSLLVVIALVGLGYFIFQSPSKSGTLNSTLEDSNSTTPTDSSTSGITSSSQGCYVGGCSGQICSEDKSAMSTCEYKEEYACYKASRCERQASGECGWTQTPEFSICLNSVLNPGADMK